jgi:hypothetical protein
MQTVVLTPTFERDAKEAGLRDEEVMEIVATIAADPRAGDVMVGTGGARKMRHRRQGRGKSGGLRTVHYFAGDDVPIFLLVVFGKGDKDNLTRAERNALSVILPRLAAAYRTGKGR